MTLAQTSAGGPMCLATDTRPGPGDAPGGTEMMHTIPILVGTSRSWFRVWAGPKLLWSHFGTSLRLSVPNGHAEQASFEGHATYAGGQAGVAIGYRNLFLGVELTLAEVFGSASVTATSLPTVGPVDFTGVVVYPAFGLMGQI